MSSIITQIWNTVVKDFTAAEQWIETAVGRVNAVMPGVGTKVEGVVKQYASDALGVVDAELQSYEPQLAKGLEGLADTALSALTGGKALPLVGITNKGVDDIVDTGVAAWHAWALKVKAQMAENNAAQGGGTSAAPSVGTAQSTGALSSIAVPPVPKVG